MGPPAGAVTGGDALLKVSGTATRPIVTLGTTDVSAVFKSDSKDGWIGLVTGLKDGDNSIAVRAAGGTATNLVLTNRPLNGTVPFSAGLG